MSKAQDRVHITDYIAAAASETILLVEPTAITSNLSHFSDSCSCRVMATPTSVTEPAEFGPALRHIRLNQRISQTALARSAGVGRQWLNSFEMGDRPSAPLDMVMRLVSVLDASILLTRPAPLRTVTVDGGIDLDTFLRSFDT
ncbi:hypothetical protein BH23ACT6_BH23ACT6_22110 [soil metagenome]